MLAVGPARPGVCQSGSGQCLVLVGDFNVTFEDRDSYDPEGLRGTVHHKFSVINAAPLHLRAAGRVFFNSAAQPTQTTQEQRHRCGCSNQ